MYHQLINRPTKSTRRANISPHYTVLKTPAFWDSPWTRHTTLHQDISAKTNAAVLCLPRILQSTVFLEWMRIIQPFMPFHAFPKPFVIVLNNNSILRFHADATA